jgi:hypothetical protein
MQLLALAAVVLVACSHAPVPAPPTGSSTPPPASSALRPAPPPHAPDTRPIAPLAVATPGIYAKACATECADEAAQLVTYRDASGAIAIVTVMGTPARCSEPPLRFLGPDGSERATIPLEPVVPGSERAKHFDAIRAQQLDGLTKAETMQCRDVKH